MQKKYYETVIQQALKSGSISIFIDWSVEALKSKTMSTSLHQHIISKVQEDNAQSSYRLKLRVSLIKKTLSNFHLWAKETYIEQKQSHDDSSIQKRNESPKEVTRSNQLDRATRTKQSNSNNVLVHKWLVEPNTKYQSRYRAVTSAKAMRNAYELKAYMSYQAQAWRTKRLQIYKLSLNMMGWDNQVYPSTIIDDEELCISVHQRRQKSSTLWHRAEKLSTWTCDKKT